MGGESRLLGAIARGISPYVAGEQPQDRKYIKLNTNECPYPPSPSVAKAIRNFDAEKLALYSDPNSSKLRASIAAGYGVSAENVFVGNGSDEVLAMAFMAFSSAGDKVYFPDITYGFYSVYADLFQLDAVKIPLEHDFSLDVSKYENADGNIFIANPNAPTGLVLEADKIEELLESNRDRLVVIDEAYMDFADVASAIDLTQKHDNLLVVRTFSKSRSLAGQRIGFAIGSEPLISGLERIKFSINPYNIDRLSEEIGIAAMSDYDYFCDVRNKIMASREDFEAQLSQMGFKVVPSQANFVFVRYDGMDGREIYEKLKENGVLVRYFAGARTGDYVRITIGMPQQMMTVTKILEKIIN